MNKKIARQKCFENQTNLQNKCELDLILCELVYNKIKGYKYIGVYSPIKAEPVLDFKEEFILCYPKVFGKEMKYFIPVNGFEKSSYGIDEPISDELTEVIPDIIIAPCVGFYQNYRLGYGGGYYDRYLSKHIVPTIGVAYKVTELSSLDINEFDIKLDTILKV